MNWKSKFRAYFHNDSGREITVANAEWIETIGGPPMQLVNGKVGLAFQVEPRHGTWKAASATWDGQPECLKNFAVPAGYVFGAGSASTLIPTPRTCRTERVNYGGGMLPKVLGRYCFE